MDGETLALKSLYFKLSGWRLVPRIGRGETQGLDFIILLGIKGLF